VEDAKEANVEEGGDNFVTKAGRITARIENVTAAINSGTDMMEKAEALFTQLFEELTNKINALIQEYAKQIARLKEEIASGIITAGVGNEQLEELQRQYQTELNILVEKVVLLEAAWTEHQAGDTNYHDKNRDKLDEEGAPRVAATAKIAAEEAAARLAAEEAAARVKDEIETARVKAQAGVQKEKEEGGEGEAKQDGGSVIDDKYITELQHSLMLRYNYWRNAGPTEEGRYSSGKDQVLALRKVEITKLSDEKAITAAKEHLAVAIYEPKPILTGMYQQKQRNFILHYNYQGRNDDDEQRESREVYWNRTNEMFKVRLVEGFLNSNTEAQQVRTALEEVAGIYTSDYNPTDKETVSSLRSWRQELLKNNRDKATTLGVKPDPPNQFGRP
jgi:hypothetical protein